LEHSTADADRASRDAALTLALTLPGDTLLYLLLPLHHEVFGVSLAEAGLLLGANRLIRIFGNQWLAHYYALRGPRAACVLAAAGAIAATLSYATVSGLWSLLVARLVWGLAFGAMNLANQALPTAIANGATQRMGRMRAIVSAGPMLGLLGGAAISETLGPRIAFFALALASLPALRYARRLPSAPDGAKPTQPGLVHVTPVNVWALFLGLTLDGLFGVGLSLLIAARQPEQPVLAAGLAMGLRYATEIALSAPGGALAQWVGARRLSILLSIGCGAGLALLGATGGAMWAGLVVTIALRALLGPLPAPLVAEIYPGPARVPALADQSTWRDLGAGFGPLLAGWLLPIMPAAAVYGAAGLLLAGASLTLAGPKARRPAPG
jgi:MFS family permease